MTAQASAADVDPAFVGSWRGRAEIVVNWTKQRTLPVAVTIASDGTVTGKVGDAEIVDGRFGHNRGTLGRALNLGTDYIITGDLRGPVIKSEGITGYTFTMPLNWSEDAFAGGVHAGRAKVGGSDRMMLSATHMKLVRGTPGPQVHAIDTYRIHLAVDPSGQHLDGEMQLDYRNTSPAALTSIRLRLDPNLSSKFSLEITQVADDRGTSLSWSYQPLQFGTQASDKGAMEIALATPLEPADVVQLAIRFESTGNHLGSGMIILQDDPLTSLDAWYPKAMSALASGWSLDDDRPSSYEVTADLPAGMTVASTGRVVAEENPEGRRVLKLQADAVRGFTVYASPTWRRHEREVDGIELAVCLPDEAEAWADRLLDATAGAIAFYQEHYTAFPCRHLDIACPGSLNDRAHGSSSGCQLITLFLGGSFERQYRMLTAHEVAHQYWSACVGFPRDDIGWVPVGLGLMMDEDCARNLGFEATLGQDIMRGMYFRAEAMGFDTTLAQSVQVPLRAPPPWSFGWNMALAHGKAYAVCALLRDLLGEDAFREVNRTLLRQRAGGLVRATDLVPACETALGESLDWFVADWIDGRATFDYAIRSVEPTASGAALVIERVGSGSFPAWVEVTTADGAVLHKRIDRTQILQTLRFETTAPVVRATLGPDGIYPDLDPSNDSWQPPAERPAAE